jgi:hypothetical protein
VCSSHSESKRCEFSQKKKEEESAREKELNELFKVAISQPKVPVGMVSDSFAHSKCPQHLSFFGRASFLLHMWLDFIKCTGCYIDIFDSWQVWTLSLLCANSFDMGSVPRVSSASIHTILVWRGRERRSIFTVISVMVGYSSMHGCLWRIVSFGCFRFGGIMIVLLALIITNCRKHGGLGSGNPRKGCGIQGE